MTITDALRLRPGDYVLHSAGLVYRTGGDPVQRPIRVTAVWVNDRRTIVNVRLASIDKDAWLDATGYEWPPEGRVWDRSTHEWLTPEEQAERKQRRVQ